ncbi:MAG: alpha/beta fold hydrolase [Pseudomonadota bacterium]
MAITTRAIDYGTDDKFEGMLALDESATGPRPAVLVAHAWAGRSDFEVDKAKDIAGLGYAGFALDLYGKGVLGQTKEENQALMTPLLEDRAKLQSQLAEAVAVVKAQPEVDETKVVAIGYCFGGLCVLDLARMGADVLGVASFHGLFNAPGNLDGKTIDAKVLALHGWDDPMATPDQAVAFAAEMNERKADWQLHGYGGTVHAFTNPHANDPEFGTVYSKTADTRSWVTLRAFLDELFA